MIGDSVFSGNWLNGVRALLDNSGAPSLETAVSMDNSAFSKNLVAIGAQVEVKGGSQIALLAHHDRGSILGVGLGGGACTCAASLVAKHNTFVNNEFGINADQHGDMMLTTMCSTAITKR